MANKQFWQLIQNNRFLRPFQVRDIGGKTLIDRARVLVILAFLALIGIFLVSSRHVNLLLNRDFLERQENNFILTFYPTYDSLYYWLEYQGNLASKLAELPVDEKSAQAFVDGLADDLALLPHLKYVQLGRVGINSQWVAEPSDEGWQLSSEVNQDFAAWLLTKELSSDTIYWYNGHDRSDELALFWLYGGEDGEKVYFLAAVDFPYNQAEVVPTDSNLAGVIVFVSDSGEQRLFPLASLAEATVSGNTARDERHASSRPTFFAGELAGGDILRRYQEQGREIFEFNSDGRHFWVKMSPAMTRTDYTLMAIVTPEVEPLSRVGVRSVWIVWALVSLILINFLLFIYYYLRYSRRYYFTNQIKDIIKNGESAGLEFKSSLRFDLKERQLNKALEGAILKSVAAFNNTDGGLLIIGVSDDARVLGLQDDYSTLKKPDKDGFELHLRALISQAYGEHFAARRVEIFFPVLENKEVCVVKVKKGRSALYTSAPDKNGTKLEKFYIRMGNSSREIEKLSDIVDYQNQRFKFHLPKWDKK